MKKTKAIAILATVLSILTGLAIWAIAAPDQAVSRAERRKLAQAPELRTDAVFSGQYMTDLETYLLDQFPGRDFFRGVQARIRFQLLRQKDSNGIYLAGDSACKLEDPLKEKQVLYAAEKINEVLETYLPEAQAKYAIVPDKNYFAAEAGGYPHMDYDRLVSLMREHVNAEYVDLFPLLSLDDYYRTDAHWKQEALFPVAEALGGALCPEMDLIPAAGFEKHTLSPFYGVYSGQAAIPLSPDTLTYLTSEAIDAATMTGLEWEGTSPIYTVEKFEGMDGYDVFAGGAQAIVTMESPLAKTGRELLIFRDSYGSSLAPLFLEGYSKVTLIDLRYIPAAMLAEYVDFTDQDVLFLYSTSLLNAGMLLR